MIRLIASDIDGTLVRDGGSRLDPEYYDVIRELRRRGVWFAGASGRQWVGIERLFEPVREEILYLSDNGAYIGRLGEEPLLRVIDRNLCVALAEDIRRTPGLVPLVSGPDTLYVETEDEAFVDWLLNGYRFHIQRVEDITRVEGPFIKVSAFTRRGIRESVKDLMARYGGRLQMTLAGEMWMDCMGPGVSKGQAVGVLQERMGILPRETMVFGDQMNDVEMMKRARYSFAVSNALPEVKAAARFRADANVRDGVLKVLRLLL